jgi:hypothetical protein
VPGSNHATAKTEPSKIGTARDNTALTLWAMTIGFVMRDRTQEGFSGLEMPLARMLAINLGIGVAVAVLLVGGLLVLNPGGLRDLILADRSPLVPIGLLLGGFIVTLGSTAMGTAIMAMGVGERDGEPRGGLRVVKQRAARENLRVG